MEFIEISTGRISKKNLDTEGFKSTEKDNTFEKKGKAWPRIDKLYWGSKGTRPSGGFMDLWRATKAAGDQERSDTKATSPLDACKKIKESAAKTLGQDAATKFEADTLKAFTQLGLKQDESPFYIDTALFYKTLHGENGLYDTGSEPMKSQQIDDDEDDFGDEGATSHEGTSYADNSSSKTKHEIIDAYILFENNQRNQSKSAMREEFSRCIGGLRTQCKTMYDSIPDTQKGVDEKGEPTEADVDKLEKAIDTLRIIETNGLEGGDEDDTADPIDKYHNALDMILNSGMSETKKRYTPRDSDTDNKSIVDAYDWYMDLFIFAYRKYREYENEWVETATAIAEGKGKKSDKYKQFGGAEDDSSGSDSEGEQESSRNNAVVYHDDEEGAVGQDNTRNIPARPNPLIVIPAIMAMVYLFLQLANVVNRINNAFSNYHERVQLYQLDNGQADLFSGPDPETCHATFSFAILYEFLRNYFWSGFEMSLSEMSNIARGRLTQAASVIANEASAVAADTWTWGSLSYFANLAAGTSTRYVTQVSRNQATFEANAIFQNGMLDFNNWSSSFDYTIRSTSTTLVLGLNGLMATTIILLNQINPYAVNRHTVMAAIGSLSTQAVTPAGEVPIAAMGPFFAQLGLTVRGVRNFMRGRLDTFGSQVPIFNTPSAPAAPATIQDGGSFMNAITHYTGRGNDGIDPPNQLETDYEDQARQPALFNLDLLAGLVSQQEAMSDPTGDLLAAAEGKSDGEKSDSDDENK